MSRSLYTLHLGVNVNTCRPCDGLLQSVRVQCRAQLRSDFRALPVLAPVVKRRDNVWRRIDHDHIVNVAMRYAVNVCASSASAFTSRLSVLLLVIIIPWLGLQPPISLFYRTKESLPPVALSDA